MKLKCIKGISTTHFVVCLQGDIVEVKSIDENEIEIKGIFGWCANQELCLTANEVATCFSVWPSTVEPNNIQIK
jgi:hypothetical protein